MFQILAGWPSVWSKIRTPPAGRSTAEFSFIDGSADLDCVIKDLLARPGTRLKFSHSARFWVLSTGLFFVAHKRRGCLWGPGSDVTCAGQIKCLCTEVLGQSPKCLCSVRRGPALRRREEDGAASIPRPA